MEGFLLRALDEPGAAGRLVAVTVPAPVVAIDRILAARPGGPLMAFTDPGEGAWSFAGWGEAARVEGTGDKRLEQVRRAADEVFASLEERSHPELEGVPAPRLFGGVAFRTERARPAPWSAFADASFALPKVTYGVSGERAFLRLVLRAGDREARAAADQAVNAVARAAALEAAPSSSIPGTRVDRTTAEAWAKMIAGALFAIRSGELAKVVPTTLSHVKAGAPIDAAAALGRLAAGYPSSARFAFQRGDAVFLGASPERLVERRGLTASADALAGTARRSSDAGDDARIAAELLSSDKDRREHQAVVLAVRAGLEPFARSVDAPAAPSLRSLRNVHHLHTPVVATLVEERPAHVLDLVAALHPTPAVCGTPREAALAWIAKHEEASRGWYAGAVGFFDAAGDGDFRVAIRSGLVVGAEAFLYAGAGIVEGSDAALEYAETRLKQAPMLAALGLWT